MRKTAILTLLLFLVQISFSQSDSTAYQKLQKQFTDVYKKPRANAEGNFIMQLYDAAFFTVRMNNPLFFTSLRELDKVYPGREIEWSIKKLTDSLIAATVKEQLWSGMEEVLAKNKATLDIYNARICECVSAQIKKEEDYRNLLTVTQSCDLTMMQDPLFVNRLQVSMVSLTMEERMQLQRYASRYSYQNCPLFYAAMNDAVLQETVGYYYGDMSYLVDRLEERAAALWKAGKRDSLAVLFPGYKKAEADLQNASALIEKGKFSQISKKENKEQTTVTRTFAPGPKPTRLLGQLVYTYSVKETVVKIHSLKFVPENQIPNKKALLEEMSDDDLPPPIEVLPTGN